MSGPGAEGRGARGVSRRLRVALLAYPRAARRRDGDVLLDLAGELVDDGASSVGREAAALVRGGARMRLRPLRRAAWHRALRHAATVVVILYAGLVGATAATSVPAWHGWPGLAWIVLLLATAGAVAGVSTRRWGLLATATTVLIAIGAATSNGHLATVAPWFDLDLFFDGLGFGYTLPLLGWAIPPLLLCVLAAVTADPEAARVRTDAIAGWALVVAVAAWAAPFAGTALDDLAAAGLVCAAILAGAMVAGLVLGRRDPSWWLALPLLATAFAPLPLIVLSDTLTGVAPAVLAAVALLAALGATVRRAAAAD